MSSPPRPEAESRNLGKTFVANSVLFEKALLGLVAATKPNSIFKAYWSQKQVEFIYRYN